MINLQTDREIDLIVVHCADTYKRMLVGVKEITRWHLDRGWSDCGYHYVIKLDGEVQLGRPEQKIGAHVKGKNRSSVGVCYIGGMDKNMENWLDTRTDAQKASLLTLIKELQQKYPGSIVYGHKDFTSKKACPSFDAKEEYKDLTNE